MRGLGKNKLSLDDLELNIRDEYYFTAHHGYMAAFAEKNESHPGPEWNNFELKLITFCVLVLNNGYMVTGECFGFEGKSHSTRRSCLEVERKILLNSPESIEPFYYDYARKLAREDAKQKLWRIAAYENRQHFYLLEQQALSQIEKPTNFFIAMYKEIWKKLFLIFKS